MKRITVLPAMAALLALMFSNGMLARAQDQSTDTSSSTAPKEVTQGTRFLISLEEPLSTQDLKAGYQFHARTLDPVASADGTTLPVGAEIRGHVDKSKRRTKPAAHACGLRSTTSERPMAGFPW